MARNRRFSSHRARDNRHSDYTKPLPRLTEDDLYDRIRATENPLVLILDGVEDPHNLGACLRSADAAGVVAVIAPRKHTASVTDTVRSIAVGGAEHVPFVQVTNLANALETLREIGLKLVATSDTAQEALFAVDLRGPLGIVMGSEATGIRRLTSEKCDHLVYLPMQGTVDCLNLSVATGVCLFEAVRQRLSTS